MNFTRLSVLAALGTVLFFSCENQEQKGERLAKQYCGSCHVFPEPALLDKTTWEKVLPQMAFRMGFENLRISLAIPPDDLATVYNTLPAKPMVTKEEWEAIKNYYTKNAPDSLPRIDTKADTVLRQFDVTPFSLPGHKIPFVTLIKADEQNNRILIGTRDSLLYELGNDFTVKDSVQLSSTPSCIYFEKDQEMILSLMGIMDPNDQPRGEMISLKNHHRTSFIDSLKRPVFFEKADLNNDNLDDYIICAFGNYTGALLVYENRGNNRYKKHTLYGLPGARKVVVRDVNNDGLTDIVVLMTQGDEQISLLKNVGNFNFRVTNLLRFPSVYGSSYFDVADFNNDGHVDILYTNGDNADYSIVLKPYHGVHIFLNDGNNNFSQSWFHAMYGASQALAADYDNDGDMDIAAISFFPDFRKHPEQGFIYFENKAGSFIPHTTPLATAGRWLVMEAADIDHDGDCDLILGALAFNATVTNRILKKWSEKNTSLLILRNTQHQ